MHTGEHEWLESLYMMEHVCMLNRFSCVQLFAILWTVAHQALLSMGFSRQNSGVGCHVLLQGIFLTQDSNLSLLCLLHWQHVLYH